MAIKSISIIGHRKRFKMGLLFYSTPLFPSFKLRMFWTQSIDNNNFFLFINNIELYIDFRYVFMLK